MNQKAFFIVFGLLCFVAAIVMFVIGNNSSHLSELADFFYIPIPLGIICFLLAMRKRS